MQQHFQKKKIIRQRASKKWSEQNFHQAEQIVYLCYLYKKMVHAGIERERKEKKKSLQRDGPAKGPSTSEDIIRVAPQTTSEPGL